MPSGLWVTLHSPDMVDLGATTILGRSPRATSGSDPVLEEGVEIVSAPRVLIAIEPRMYAEVLAFLVGRHRPDAEISLLGPSEELEDAALCLRPHLVVATWVPKAVREEPFFWVEQDEARGGEGPSTSGQG